MTEGNLQLFLNGHEGKSTLLRIDEKASIKDLMQLVHDKTGLKKDEMRIWYRTYCRSLLTNGKYEFRCPFTDPYCGQLWEFYIIQRLAVLTKEELAEFETKIAMNYLVKAAGIQECSKCGSYCERRNRKDVRVVCPICTRKGTILFEFCWFCLRPWLTNGVKDCGNINGSGEDPRKKILRNCPKKIVVEVPNCPAVRACPKCGLMIEHISDCKQMVCRCGQKFCFICLKMASAERYQCGAYNYKCEVAPIQTELP